MGSMSGPTLTVNPLSAIAPGILRRILGAIDGTTSRGAGAHEPAETGDTRDAPAGAAVGSHRPQQHVLLAAERQLDDSAGFQRLAGDERLLVAERRVVDP